MSRIVRCIFSMTIIFACLFFCFTSVQAQEQNQETSTIYVSEVTAQQGSTRLVRVSLDNKASIAALEFELYYNQQYFEVSTAYLHYDLSSAQVSFNYDTPGVFKFTMIYEEGYTFSTALMNIHLHVKSTAPVGEYPLWLVVGEAYDKELQPIEIEGIHGKVTVTKAPTVLKQIYFYSSISNQNLYQGDLFSVSIHGYDLKQFAAGNFEYYYDKEKIKVKQIQVSSTLNHSQAIYAVNSDILGYINISYASITGFTYAYDMINIQFEVIDNVNETTKITLRPKNLYDEALQSMISNEVEFNISLKKEIILEEHPRIYTTTYDGTLGEPFDVYVRIDAESNIAAGDFILNYNSSHLEATAVEVLSDVSSSGSFLSYHPIINQGQVKFSFINENGIYSSMSLLKVTFIPKSTQSITTSLSISGSGLVNQYYQTVNLSYPSSTVKLAKYYTITFVDMDNSVLSVSQVEENKPIQAPTPPQKVGWIFSGWSHAIGNATSDLTIRAQYTQDTSIRLDAKTVSYNGTEHFLYVVNQPDHTTITYLPQQSYLNAGIYIIQAIISREGFDDLVLESTLTIEKAPIQIIVHNKESLFGQELVPLTYDVVGNLYGDEIEVSVWKEEGLDAGSYIIYAHLEHPNYQTTYTYGEYRIKGAEIDMSMIQFNDKTFEYDGTEKHVFIQGILPEGVLSVEYSNNTLTDVGTIVAIARFVVAEGYDPIENMIATLTISKTQMTGITFDTATYTYDGTEKSIAVSGIMTQHGHEATLTYAQARTQINAGEYVITATLKHPNYNDLNLQATLYIQKAERLIKNSDFTLVVSSNAVSISHPTLGTSIKYSLDGITYIKAQSMTGLQENQTYEITLYIEETQNHLPSNFITFTVKTYVSKSGLTAIIQQHQTITLSTFDAIQVLKAQVGLLQPEEAAEMHIEIQALISRYDQYVQHVQTEFQQSKSITQKSMPKMILSMVSIAPMLWMLKKRRDLK